MEAVSYRSKPARNDAASPGAQAEKSERMRKAVLATAVGRLAALGYHATSIKKIAQAGKFSVGALQHHFPTKEALMVAVVARALERAENYARRHPPAGGRGGIARLLVASWHDQIQTDWYLAMLEIFVAARTDAKLRGRIAPLIRDYAEVTERRIAAAAAGGADDEAVAFLIAVTRCMMGGLLIQDALAMPARHANEFVRRWGGHVERVLAEGAEAR
jgi:AcrR family transcriptional regulator